MSMDKICFYTCIENFHYTNILQRKKIIEANFPASENSVVIHTRVNVVIRYVYHAR